LYNAVYMLILMVIGHCLADFPLQGEYLAKMKNPNVCRGNNDIGWVTALLAHGAIHAGFVLIITHSIALFILELCVHCFLDYEKCRGRIGVGADQFLHVLSKVVWVCIYLYATTP
jgi:hypothetical protein